MKDDPDIISIQEKIDMKKAKLVSMGQSGLDFVSFVSKRNEISK